LLIQDAALRETLEKLRPCLSRRQGRPNPESASTSKRLPSHPALAETAPGDWLQVEYGIAKPSDELLTVVDLISNTWVSDV
jgi:hypothetical protein